LVTFSPGKKKFTFGLLGLINGLLAYESEVSPIKAYYDKKGKLIKFKCITEPIYLDKNIKDN
jgi:hypothetical protein